MDLKDFAVSAIKLAERLTESGQYALAIAKLEILKLEIERQIRAIEAMDRLKK